MQARFDPTGQTPVGAGTRSAQQSDRPRASVAQVVGSEFSNVLLRSLTLQIRPAGREFDSRGRTGLGMNASGRLTAPPHKEVVLVTFAACVSRLFSMDSNSSTLCKTLRSSVRSVRGEVSPGTIPGFAGVFSSAIVVFPPLSAPMVS